MAFKRLPDRAAHEIRDDIQRLRWLLADIEDAPLERMTDEPRWTAALELLRDEIRDLERELEAA